MWSAILKTVAIKTVGFFLHKLRDKWAAEIEAEKKKRICPEAWRKVRIVSIYALMSFSLCGCSFKQTFVEWYDNVLGNGTTIEETTTPEVYDQTEAQELANKSPRISDKTLPKGAPTIEFTRIVWEAGSITIKSKTCGDGHVPEGHEYLYIVEGEDGTVENAASSHSVRDDRVWTKVKKPKRIMVVLTEGRKNIKEYSEVKTKP
jgi:hypothetical protein